jgi:hypothetical protein
MASDHHVTGVPNMTMDEFRKSLIAAQPPAELTPALVGLWWDAKGDWTRAHESAQQDEGPEGSWVHAYLHRKEGDQGNAAYWYVGRGSLFAEIHWMRNGSASSEVADGWRFRCTITFPRFSPGLPISRSGAFQPLLPLCGSAGIHRLKRPGY